MAPRTQHESQSAITVHAVSVPKRRDLPRDLSETPQPFLDWSLIETGTTNWVGEHGEAIPAADVRDYPESAVLPLQIGTPFGVRIRTQPAVKAGPIFHEAHPWEAGLLSGSSALFDEDIYRLWYFSAAGMNYAQSADGSHWARPLIDFVPFENHPSTNLLPPMENVRGRHITLREAAIFKDPNGSHEERYKAVFSASVTAQELEQFEHDLGLPLSVAATVKKRVLFGAVSPDGFSWWMSERPLMLHPGDMQVTVEYDPLLRRYVGCFHGQELGRRTLARAETEDFWRWPLPATVLAPGPDEEPGCDYAGGCLASYAGNPEIKLIFLTRYDAGADRTEVGLAMSRDGLCWHRVPGPPLIACGEEGAFDGGGVTANAGLLFTADRQFGLIYTGSNRPVSFPKTAARRYQYGYAWWPKDRLAALEAAERGECTTVQLRLRGAQLLLNLQTERVGEVRVEVRDSHFRPVPGRTFADCDALAGDHTRLPVTWRGDGDLGALKGHIIYLRFRLRAARLFSLKAA